MVKNACKDTQRYASNRQYTTLHTCSHMPLRSFFPQKNGGTPSLSSLFLFFFLLLPPLDNDVLADDLDEETDADDDADDEVLFVAGAAAPAPTIG